MAEEGITQDENLRLAELRFKASKGDTDAVSVLKKDLIERKALPLYLEVATELDWPKDGSLHSSLEADIAKELEELDAKVKDAEENAGESEVREALLARAKFFERIFDRKKAEEAFEKTFSATVGTGQKIDIVLAMIRMGLAAMDYKSISKHITRAKELVEKGGDWERRNRLKVYEATYLASRRDIKGAAVLFLDSLQTFSATELYDYKTFVFYTVITSMVSVDRPTLKSKVADAPEILSVVLENDMLNKFLSALIDCDYRQYTVTLPDILDIIGQDRYLSTHKNFIGRELRVVSYTQFLSSYQSVTMAAMCRNFGVGSKYMDGELSRFIAAGRLNCKIDMVGGVVETTRPDAKNALYHNTIKQGDVLLNRIQNLSRVIDI
ncbi:26S Proteasome non-ATPase regulatory subunit 6 [Gracilaria domingensis]|nr:26S Proteasome non-ATPase regulatory subunit 6 [Gracilaria domingensis]